MLWLGEIESMTEYLIGVPSSQGFVSKQYETKPFLVNVFCRWIDLQRNLRVFCSPDLNHKQVEIIHISLKQFFLCMETLNYLKHCRASSQINRCTSATLFSLPNPSLIFLDILQHLTTTLAQSKLFRAQSSSMQKRNVLNSKHKKNCTHLSSMATFGLHFFAIFLNFQDNTSMI